jgi:DNA-binding response OmpR family regulator
VQYLCLIIERDAEAAQRLQRELPTFGFKPYIVDSCQAALAMLRLWNFDAVVLDSAGFGAHAIEALRRLHRRVRAPVVLLAHTSDEAVQLDGLESGAREVVALPASTRLLAARMRRLVEIDAEPADGHSELTIGPLAMDARRGTASIDDRPLTLTAHQFDLLYLLAARPGQFVHRETIARALRSSALESGRSADVHVYRIRRKVRELGVTNLRLDTVHGRGYCLSIETPQVDSGFDDLDAPTPPRQAPQPWHARD